MSAAVPNSHEGSVFQTAALYGAGTLTVAGVGVAVCLGTGGTATALITGIALAVIGSYAFIGVVAAGFSSDTPKEFKEKVWRSMATTVGLGASDTFAFVVKIVIMEAIQSFFNNRRR